MGSKWGKPPPNLFFHHFAPRGSSDTCDTDTQTVRQTHRKTDRQTDRKTDRQTDTQKDRQTDRQTKADNYRRSDRK